MSWHELTMTLELAVLDAAMIILTLSIQDLRLTLKDVIKRRFMTIVGKD